MNTGLENLAWGLAKRGHDVHILSGGERPHVNGYVFPRNVHYHFTESSGSPLSFVASYKEIIKGKKIDIVIGWIKNLSPLSLLPDRNKPIFIANQGALTNQYKYGRFSFRKSAGLLFKACTRKISFKNAIKIIIDPFCIYSQINFIVPNSEAVKNNVYEYFGIPYKKMKVIYRGVDTEYYKPSLKCFPNRSNERPRLIFVGNVISSKGVFELAHAVACLNSPVDMVFCGNVHDADHIKIERIIASGEAPHSVVFLGAIDSDSLLHEYQRSDIFVLPSYAEGFNKAVLEAMSCELPVIVSGIPTFLEAVTHEKNGLVVPVKCSKPLTKVLSTLMNDAQLRESLGVVARKSVVSYFSIESELDAWCELINEYTSFNK
ncbi:MAG: glycosyltransferase family 4 protein [Pseudomonadota bacterium]